MNRLLIVTSIAGLIAITLTGLIQTDRGWIDRLGSEAWNSASWQQPPSDGDAALQELDVKCRAVLGRVAMKSKIAEELLAGKLDLRQAGAAFRDLNAESEHLLPQMLRAYPGASADECHCRNVISYAGNGIRTKQERDRIMAELEQELERMRQEDGGQIRLAN
jgi:hypothetical protein